VRYQAAPRPEPYRITHAPLPLNLACVTAVLRRLRWTCSARCVRIARDRKMQRCVCLAIVARDQRRQPCLMMGRASEIENGAAPHPRSRVCSLRTTHADPIRLKNLWRSQFEHLSTDRSRSDPARVKRSSIYHRARARFKWPNIVSRTLRVLRITAKINCLRRVVGNHRASLSHFTKKIER
jgi:hypothetical protein